MTHGGPALLLLLLPRDLLKIPYSISWDCLHILEDRGSTLCERTQLVVELVPDAARSGPCDVGNFILSTRQDCLAVGKLFLA